MQANAGMILTSSLTLTGIRKQLYIMKAVLEKVQTTPAASFRFFRRVEDHYPFVWHRHPEYELVAIVSGQGQRFVGDHSDHYNPGDLVLIGPNLPHTWHSHATAGGNTRSEAIVIQFARDCMGDGFFDLPEMLPISRLLDESMLGIQFSGKDAGGHVKRMSVLCEAPAPERLVGLLAVLCSLARLKERQNLSTRAFSDKPCSERESRLDTALRFIHAHYTEPVRQEQVASRMHMSGSAFCRFFKRCTGKTFVTYVNELRVGHACRMLIETDHTVAEICYAAGFGNLSHFNRQFRRFKNMKPSEFRTLHGG